MATPDGRYVVTYNGELYNFQELRTELQALGHRFVLASDTEVLLAALAEWGTGALARFNGMFAFALYDRHERRLLLARDRFGVKPLYWARVGGKLLFGSGSEGDHCIARVPRRTRYRSSGRVSDVPEFLHRPDPVQGRALLPPGTFMTVAVGGEPRFERYWDFDFHERLQARARNSPRSADRLFRQAVSRQLMSDVPVAA